jgi:hypothetical protein
VHDCWGTGETRRNKFAAQAIGRLVLVFVISNRKENGPMKYTLFSFIFLALAGSASAQGYFGGVGGDGGMGRWHGVMPQPPVTLKAPGCRVHSWSAEVCSENRTIKPTASRPVVKQRMAKWHDRGLYRFRCLAVAVTDFQRLWAIAARQPILDHLGGAAVAPNDFIVNVVASIVATA